MTDTPKHPGGRPRLYQSHDEFADKVESYFDEVEANGKKPTLAGLCYFMGFDDKESFTHYSTYGVEFSRTVKRVKMRMEDDRQQSLLSKDKFTPGIALDLQNNHGWRNKTDHELTGADGGPMVTQTRLKLDGLSDEELVTMGALMAKAVK